MYSELQRRNTVNELTFSTRALSHVRIQNCRLYGR
nr:MAG TPA: hypothetical protein [Crassvirales sp.]